MNAFFIDPKDGEGLAEWALRVADELLALQLLPSDEVAFEKSSGGTFIRLFPKGAAYLHPFLPTLSNGGLTFRKGTVQAGSLVTPTIQKKQLIDDDEVGSESEPAPVLELKPEQMDAETLTSWAVLEIDADENGQIILDEKGNLPDGTRCEIIHAPRPDAVLPAAPNTGRQALAQILWSGGKPAYVFPCVHHNLAYIRTFPVQGQGLPRHFFWAV